MLLRRATKASYQRGFTLTELAISLVILAIILGGIWVAGRTVIINNQVRIAAQQLATITQSVRTAFAEQGGVTDIGGGALTQALDQLRAFPLDMRQDSATPSALIFDIWSQRINGGLGTAFVTADKCDGTADTTNAPQPCFGITFVDIPQNACVQMLTQTTQAGIGLHQVEVNTTVAGVVGGVDPIPVPASSAAAACNNNNATGNNDILWTFRLKDNNS